MEKIIDIVFVKSIWKMSNEKRDTFEDGWEYSKRMKHIGLDKAHKDLETKIKQYLNEGWVLRGDVAYHKFHKNEEGGYLVQTLVKYQSTDTNANLIEM